MAPALQSSVAAESAVLLPKSAVLALGLPDGVRHVGFCIPPHHVIPSIAPMFVRGSLLAKVICIVVLTDDEVQKNERTVRLVFRI